MHKPPRTREEKLPGHPSTGDLKQLEKLGEELKTIQIARDEKYKQLASCLRTIQARQLRLQRMWTLRREREQLMQRLKALTARNKERTTCAAAHTNTSAEAKRQAEGKADSLKTSQVQLQEMMLHEQRVWRHLEFLRWRLVGKLKSVFPLHRPVEPETAYTIGGLQLPNSDFTGCDEEEIAAALGCVAHVLALLGKWFDVPLRYAILFLGSRTLICDEIAHSASPRFPLFSRGVDRARFEYGVYLLNKNLEQLLQSQGFLALNLKQTLPNLATFMNHQLRPASSVPSALPMSASLSVLPGTSLLPVSVSGSNNSPPCLQPMGSSLVRTLSTTPPANGNVHVVPRYSRRESPSRRSAPSSMMPTYSPPRKVTRPTGVSPGQQAPSLHHSHSSSSHFAAHQTSQHPQHQHYISHTHHYPSPARAPAHPPGLVLQPTMHMAAVKFPASGANPPPP